MYTVIMNDNKKLTATKVTTLYQGENLVDKLRFLIPMVYCESDLSSFSVKLICVNQGNIGWTEDLELSTELYENIMLCYYLPIDSQLTKYAGDIRIKLAFEKDTGQILYSDESVIKISPTKLYVQHIFDNPSDDPTDVPSSGDSSGGFKVVEF